MPLKKRKKTKHVFYAKLAFCPVNKIYDYTKSNVKTETEKIYCGTESRLNVAIQAVVKKKMKEKKSLVKMKTEDFYEYN